MGSSPVNGNNLRGTNNDKDAANGIGVTSSSLLKSTNGLRNDLISRNLYTPNRIYPITEKNQVQNIINAIGGIASLIAPFKSYDLKNTIYGRLVVNNTPLTEIGLAMLGKQFAMNAGSHIAQQTFPTIKLANLFDGDKNTKLFTKNKNFKITKKPAITNFQGFLNAVVFYDPSNDNPFKYPKSTNVNSVPISESAVQNNFVINQTGDGQLTFLFNAINQNIYKEGFSNSPTDRALQQTSLAGKIIFNKRYALIGKDESPQNKYKKYYNYFKTNPYSDILPSDGAILDANIAMVYGMNNPEDTTVQTQEYAPNADFVTKNFGVSNKLDLDAYGDKLADNVSENSWVGTGTEFKRDFSDSNIDSNNLVWGRDGISDVANSNINYLRGEFGDADKNYVTPEGVNLPNMANIGYQIRTGLLEYTRNLLNASEGAVVDITRKAFTDKGKNVVGFNGSALWKANYSAYSTADESEKNNIGGKTGVRQHSMIDQYDRFAKAIRYNGNYVYGGNENSVIFKTVMPRIHPTIDKDKNGNDVMNNTNLMFSLENLAVRVIKNQDFGIIDDEYGSQIPTSEAGQFNGRLMWFPPYNIELNESTSAKYESTVMVGRNEPIYSYQNSERSATLTFSLLADYPQNLKNFSGNKSDLNRAISEFFAFGGDPYAPLTPVLNPEKNREDLIIKINEIEGKYKVIDPNVLKPNQVMLVFPNDFPKVNDNLSTAVDDLYKVFQYQIEPGCKQDIGYAPLATSTKNKDIFVKYGVVGTTNVSVSDPNYMHLDLFEVGSFSQYTATGTSTAGNKGSLLNKNLFDVFSNVNNRLLYDINIVGAASKLNDQVSGYNKALGQRRADVMKILITRRLEAMFGMTVAQMGINITTDSIGAIKSDPKNSEKKPDGSYDLENVNVIDERYASVNIIRNNKQAPVNEETLSEEDRVSITILREELSALDSKTKKQNSNMVINDLYNERGKDNAAILNGFKSVSGNYYYPAFHSQTPEDLHRRLTFLQQCMRQGSAKRYEFANDNGTLRAKNSVFGRQPICILRIGDFFFTKVIIENLTIDYSETTWDMNPEGFGMQPMIAKVTLNMKVIGGQSLKGPIDALQNAVSFNYYANSSFTDQGMYALPSRQANDQAAYIEDILIAEKGKLTEAYNNKINNTKTKP